MKNRMEWMLGFAGCFLSASAAQAEFTLTFDSADFATTSVFNDVALFEFEVVVDENLQAGGVYNNPALSSVDYRVNGVLTLPTPSGFPAFGLVRSMSGADFYSLSPESGLSFSVSSTADLSDGLQLSELDGAGSIFTLNAREFNQAPGRYHPPIFELFPDGTGQLVNADNQSTVPNPATDELVDVVIGAEYDVSLAFDLNTTIAPVPEPASLLLISAGLFIGMSRASRRSVP